MRKTIIYHNPKCITSRKTLDLIRKAGVEPTIVEYLKTPPSRAELVELIREAGLAVRDAVRTKGTPYRELGLDRPATTDAQLIDAMVAHPSLINRPFVATPQGVRLSRPPEVVLEILPKTQARTAGKGQTKPRGQPRRKPR